MIFWRAVAFGFCASAVGAAFRHSLQPPYRWRFSDGSEGVADLSRLMTRTGPMVAPLKDPAFFSRVFVEAGVPTWPNGYDYAPSALYVEMREAGALDLAARTPLPVGEGQG